MKKVLIGVLALIMVLGLVGCSSAPATPATEETNTAEPTNERQAEIDANYLKLAKFIINNGTREAGKAKDEYAEYSLGDFTCYGRLEGDLENSKITYYTRTPQIILSSTPYSTGVESELTFSQGNDACNIRFCFNLEPDGYDEYRIYFNYSVDIASIANDTSEDNFLNVTEASTNEFEPFDRYIYPEDFEKDFREFGYIPNTIDSLSISLEELGADITLTDLGFNSFEADGEGLWEATFWPNSEYINMLPKPNFNHNAPKLSFLDQEIWLEFYSYDFLESYSIEVFNEYIEQLRKKGFTINEETGYLDKEEPYFVAENSNGAEITLYVQEDYLYVKLIVPSKG